MNTLLLGPADLARLAREVGPDTIMDAVIDGVSRALGDAALDTADLVPRGGFHGVGADRGLIEWMPYRAAARREVAVKVVSYQPDNPLRCDLPTILATVGLYDVATGHPLVLADGVFLTAVRTGAASAVASRILARPGSRTLGLIGAGAQAVTQAHALSRLFPIDTVLVYDVHPPAAASLGRRIRFLNLDVRVCPLDEVERSADILCTATTVAVGDGPVMAGTNLREHVHVNAVGADFPGKVEVPAHVLRAALVCPDFPAQAVIEGECQQLRASEIGPSLIDLARDPRRWTSARDRPTVFDSTGFALEDHAALTAIVDLATARGLGTRMPLVHCPADVRDPYDFSAEADLAATEDVALRSLAHAGGAVADRV